MRQLKSRKILIYVFLFLFIGTFNNKNLNNFNLPKIDKINVLGLSDEKNNKVLESLKTFELYNLFFLNKIQIENIIHSKSYIEDYSVFKQYPSSLNIKLKETDYLAYLNKDGKKFYLGSNGKLIDSNKSKKKIPYIFGDLEIDKFFKLKEIINRSNFDYKKIKNLFFFPSGRWDIEMNSGVLIKLPKDNLEESLKLSFNILSDKNFLNIKIIDVRQLNQVVLNGQ